MAAPIIFTAAEVFYLHYARRDPVSASTGDSSSSVPGVASVHTDPSLASTLEQLGTAQAAAHRLKELLRVTEERSALMAHELEMANARTIALCEQRVAALVVSRDKYRARAMALASERDLGMLLADADKENFLSADKRGKRKL